MSLVTQTYSSSAYGTVLSSSIVSRFVATAVSSSVPVASSVPVQDPWSPGASLRSSFMGSVTAGLFLGAILLGESRLPTPCYTFNGSATGVHTITLGHALVGAWRRKAARDRWMLLAVPSALWTVSLIYEICSIVFTFQAWEAGQEGIANRTAFLYFWNNSNPGLTTASAAAFLVSTIIADGFLVGANILRIVGECAERGTHSVCDSLRCGRSSGCPSLLCCSRWLRTVCSPLSRYSSRDPDVHQPLTSCRSHMSPTSGKTAS